MATQQVFRQPDGSNASVSSSSNTMAASAANSSDNDLRRTDALQKSPAAAGSKELPKRDAPDMVERVRYKYASTYRKIFGGIFTINLAVLVAVLVVTKGDPASWIVVSVASANLMCCLLFRQEEFVNLMYELFTCAPLSWPLGLRKRLAKVYHYGGCHSGAGTAAVAWYLLYTALATRDYIREPLSDVLVNMVTSWIVVLMFLLILTAAHPSLRRRYHDYFEMFHRFAGWTALVSFWVQVAFAVQVRARQQNKPVGIVLVTSPNFWFFCVSTSCSLISWSRLRHHAVYPEKLSDHATRLHFRYRPMQPFYGVKLSDAPLTEWHAFATIPDTAPTSADEAEKGDKSNITGFSVVVSNAGDWTRKQIAAAEGRKLWVRGAPLHGVLYTSRLFRRIVVVATGSGIGPCLSLMFAKQTPMRVLWSTRDPQKTYGDGVVAAVRSADPNALIWNTTERGYPDIVAETNKLVQESDAEAVFVISNPKVTDKVVMGMLTRGVAAYGAIFDS
ncbi:hypothetical protein PG999_002759 [Apiospora kogelbergensis]|uniref:Non-ribosomal peptide synthetase n=1 Tax=Apiospora kogelbergensis TaxID=1337665 RepID=A0AAW0R928_9PEZI